MQLGAEIDKDIEEDGMSYYDAFKYEILKRSGKSRYPNDHDFEDKFMVYDLYNAKAAIKKYILERLENYGNMELVAVEQLINDGTLTIEHIMPQTLTDDWKDMLGEKWELVHSKYKDTVGNLTLTAYNSDYSNSPFKIKKAMPEKGFEFSKLSLNEFIKQCESWSETEIIERAKNLFKKAVKIWWIPDIQMPSGADNEEWFDWDEETDVTDKRIIQVTIMESVINTSDVTAAYKVIHKALYDMEPTMYHNGSFVWFSKYENKLRKPYQIGADAYIETNKSSQEKLNTIRIIAELCKMDSHDIRFLVQEKSSKPKFDVNNEFTYANLTVGKLAFELFQHLIEKDAISEEEIDMLKTKEYTKQLFNHTDYPVIADSRDANKGNSRHIRYRKKSMIFKGKDIFITTQWFEGNRTDLISWYKKHIQ